MPKVNVLELEQGYHNWCEFFGEKYDDRGLSLNDRFCKFAGVDDGSPVLWADTSGHYVNVGERTAHCLALLASPHWRTLLKAWQVNNEETKP